MTFSYDSEADAAYLSLRQTTLPGEAVQHVGPIDTPNGISQVNLDFDSTGHPPGIEILAASLALSRAILLEAGSP